MTYKNAKTILFAGLIAAMILPFSGMMTAEAVEDKDLFDAKKIKSILADKLDKAKKDKSLTKDDKQREKLDRIIERVDIFSKLTDLKEAINNETDEKEIAKLDAKAQKLIVKYQNTVQPDEIEMAAPVEAPVSLVASNSISFSTTQARPAECNNPNQMFGYHTGNGDSYATHIIMDNWASYTSSIGTGGGLDGCDIHNGEYLENKLQTLTDTCWHYMWPVSGTWNNMQCNTIQWLDVVLVSNQAWYAGGNPFNAAYGWTIMVT